ncbi:hypothetical protein [Trichormus variabilis]|uniref:hypothetical protein n=2 Tax=Anabaena variabilis TaxID=264691 RepID=UPI00168379C1|nr:hypothetical protein [Trichormus variabilis]MBD2625929.1 hypothetical protein [Trichormus variabilis FACHB-164]
MVYQAELENIGLSTEQQQTSLLQEGWKEIGDRVSILIAKAWLDAEFKERLLADPRGTLEIEGIQIPAGVRVQIDQLNHNWSVGSTSGLSNDVVWRIPLAPKPADISEEQLTAFTSGNLLAIPPDRIPNCC